MEHHEVSRTEAVPAFHPSRCQPQRNSGRSLLTTTILLALVSAGSVAARADDQIRAVRLSNVVGSVQIMSGADAQFSQAYPNMPLMQGSTLKTGEDGRAEIQLEDGSVVRLTPNSSAAMAVLSRTSDGNTSTEVDLLSGLSYVEMKGTANQRFVVHFGANQVISPAPVKFRVNLDANPTEFAVLDGSANLSNGTVYAVDVHANDTVRFDSADSSRYLLAQGVDPDSWDQWNTDRDRAMGQMAAQETREARGSVNPGDPGWNDLDYYGNWYSSGGSSFWVPAGAGAGWDPYGSGYWGYYGGAGGYVWISGYPWGWLPYHCGDWNYYNNVGWGWAPGGCGSVWYPAAPVGNAPSRYKPLPRPVAVVHPLPGNQGNTLRHPISRPLIAVDRGPEATTLAPRLGATPRTVAIGGQEARLMPKSPSSTVVLRQPSRSDYSGPVMTGFNDGRQLGNVPVYRPVAPTNGYRPDPSNSGYRLSSPTLAGRPSGGFAGASQPGAVSAPRSGGSSMPVMSAPSHSNSGGGMSGGGVSPSGGGRAR